MVGDGNSKALYQIILISGVSGDQFNLVVWTKGKDIDYGGGNIGWGMYFHNPEDGLWYLGGGLGNSDDGSSPWTLSSLYVSATAPTNPPRSCTAWPELKNTWLKNTRSWPPILCLAR